MWAAWPPWAPTVSRSGTRSNLDREWPAGQINPATYTDLLRRSYLQIKAKNANTLVISGALSPTGAEGAFGLDHVWNDNHYLAGMMSAGCGQLHGLRRDAL